jgi:hypothetical protein
MTRNFKLFATATSALVLASALGVAFSHAHVPPLFESQHAKAATASAPLATGNTQRHLVRVVDVTGTPCAAGAPDPDAVENEKLALLAHQSRLEAELAGRATIFIPQELHGRETTEPVRLAFREEAAAMQSHLTQVAEQIVAVQQSIELMKREGEVIQEKDTMMQRQVSLLQDQRDNVDALLKRGSATVTQKLALEQTLAQYESTHLDLQLSGLKSRQELLKAQQSIADARTQLRSQDLIELSQTQVRLSDLSKGAAAANTQKPAGAACDQAPGPVFEIVRGADGGIQVLPVAPMEKLKLDTQTKGGEAFFVEGPALKRSSSTVSANAERLGG